MVCFVRRFRFAVFVLLFGFSISSQAAKLSKVDVCHVAPKKWPVVISVSENDLPAHLAHGDGVVGFDVNESCEPLAINYCVLGLFPPFDDELHDVTYNPSTGEVVGEGFTFEGPLIGTINPPGPPEDSIFAPGSVYQFVFRYDGLEDYQWSSTATSTDDSGEFTGAWQYDDVAIIDNDGPAAFYFLEGECSCDIPDYTGPCPNE